MTLAKPLTQADQTLLTLMNTPAFLKHTFLVNLDHQGILSIEGPDAAIFLQGQVTCDVRELAAGVTRLGAQCNIKGRMLISFRALQVDDQHILLRMPLPLIEKALASFGKYIVFSKAKLHDRSHDYRRIGLVGPAAESLLRSTLGNVPETVDAWQVSANHLIIKLDQQRYECWLSADTADAVISTLTAQTLPAAENFWTLLDIRAGIGEVRPESYELFTPQSLNYQFVNAINFRKGCYTGQEIVARLHYRGTLKRHMYRVQFDSDPTALPLVGSPVHNANGQPIGEIVMAAYCAENRAEALANIIAEQLDQAFAGTKKLERLPLPYAIPTEENT